MEKTLVILKPCTVQRGLIGEIVNQYPETAEEGTPSGRHEDGLAN